LRPARIGPIFVSPPLRKLIEIETLGIVQLLSVE
jgi:hypothetical protein